MEHVSRILKAETFFQRLNLPNQKIDVASVKKAYRKLALVVHPDKCKIAGSDEAFKLLTEAFENLSNEEKQDAYLHKITAQKEREIRKKRREDDLAEYFAKRRKTTQEQPKKNKKEEKDAEMEEETPPQKASPPKPTPTTFAYSYSRQEPPKATDTKPQPPTQSLSCTICKRSFPNKKALMRHLAFSNLNHKFPRATKKKESEPESIFPDVS